MDAIILAAGMGIRTRTFQSLPKGFIKVGGETLIEQSIKILRFFNINKIYIVTGYGAKLYYDLYQADPDVELIYNKDYETKGSLHSWCLLKNIIQNDFLLLESDIIYSENYIQEILAIPTKNTILLSPQSGAHDAVFVSTENNLLAAIDKNPIENIAGEFTGISKITLDAFYTLIQNKNENMFLFNQGHYDTDGLLLLSKLCKNLFCHTTNTVAWCEIDDYQHLLRAKAFYLKIRNNSKIFNCNLYFAREV